MDTISPSQPHCDLQHLRDSCGTYERHLGITCGSTALYFCTFARTRRLRCCGSGTFNSSLTAFWLQRLASRLLNIVGDTFTILFTATARRHLFQQHAQRGAGELCQYWNLPQLQARYAPIGDLTIMTRHQSTFADVLPGSRTQNGAFQSSDTKRNKLFRTASAATNTGRVSPGNTFSTPSLAGLGLGLNTAIHAPLEPPNSNY